MSQQPQAAVDPLASTWRREIATLLRTGPRARHALIRIADRGDWRGRVLALSALGTLVRNERTAHRPSVTGILARIPGIRRSLNTVGRHGRLVSRSLVHATVDPSFIVRTAGALALGECRDPALAAPLTALLSDPFRPVRGAAAAALLACTGGSVAPDLIAAAPERTPELMADDVPTEEWLRELAHAHADLLRDTIGRAGLTGLAADDVAEWLAGPRATYGIGGAMAEAARYEDERDLEYQLAKPFGAHDRADNIRQLDAFVALVSHLDLPRGARVVDLGGGSGWAGELLGRFGFTPIVLDVSPSLLRLARARLANARLPKHVVAADMTALPIRAASVDAVLAIDALHHVADLDRVFAEVRRVLVPGGAFLLAEPGEGHSESAKSLAETHEQGVRESEIHPHTVERCARRAGFDDVTLLPRVPAQTKMTVDELRGAVTGRAARWRVTSDGQETEFDTLVLRTVLARPLMVLRAGTRVADTRAPGTIAADIQPSLARREAQVAGHVVLRNTGDTVWLHQTDDGIGAVSLGLQLLDCDGRLLDREWARCPLPRDVQPGAQVSIAVGVMLPDPTGRFRVKLDLVAERVCWFEDRGSRAAYVDL